MSALGGRVADLGNVLGRLEQLDAPFSAAAQALADTFRRGGKVLAAGNGGSAAEAQHFTAELLGRLGPDRPRGPLAAVALHADTSTLTALANDFGYDEVFARQVEAIGRPVDTLLVLSTSGSSDNLIRAVEVAARIGMDTIALLGAGERPLHEKCSHVLAVPSAGVQTIQECHLLLVHALVEEVEDRLAADATR